MARPPWTESLVIGDVKVKPTARYVVKPATKTLDCWMALSNLDRVVNPTFSSAIFFYRNLITRANRTFEQIMVSLRETLAMTLVHFYPLAGRLALRDDGLVELLCNDEGAVVVEASVDADLDEIGGPQPMPALSGLEIARLGAGPLYVPDQLRQIPVLVIQVTHFKKCGSIAVVANWHHTVADGSSGCHFMKSWSEIALGKELSLKPDHDRTQLRPRNRLDSTLVRGYSTRNVHEMLSRNPSAEAPTEPALIKCFPLPKQIIQGLKAQVTTDSREYTSAESISGHLWKAMTKARMDPSGDVPNNERAERSTSFFMFVDGRKKLGLAPGYFGNVVCSACATSSEDEITKRPISYAADLIKEATRSITGEYFRSLIDWVEEQGQSPSKSEHVNSTGHDVAATFWSFFSLYQVDLGWGKPDFSARNSAPRRLIDGIAVMPAPQGEGNMLAMLNLHADRMERLEKDEAFSTVYAPEKIPSQPLHDQQPEDVRTECTSTFEAGDACTDICKAYVGDFEFLQWAVAAWRFCTKFCFAMLILAWKTIQLGPSRRPDLGRNSYVYSCSTYDRDGHSAHEGRRQISLPQQLTILQPVFNAWTLGRKICTAVPNLGWIIIESIIYNFLDLDLVGTPVCTMYKEDVFIASPHPRNVQFCGTPALATGIA